jgi:hypothetical protein
MMSIQWIKLGDYELLNINTGARVLCYPKEMNNPTYTVIFWWRGSQVSQEFLGAYAENLWDHLLAGAWTPPAAGEPENTETKGNG